MKRIGIGASILALGLIAAAASAGPLPSGGLTAQETASWLQSKGYRAEIQADDNGKSKIASAAQGVNFFIHFYDCKSDRCASMQFVAGFTTGGKYTLTMANDWNAKNRWGTASMDKDADPWISRDVDLSPGGTYELLSDELHVWDDTIARFRKTIGD